VSLAGGSNSEGPHYRFDLIWDDAPRQKLGFHCISKELMIWILKAESRDFAWVSPGIDLLAIHEDRPVRGSQEADEYPAERSFTRTVRSCELINGAWLKA
jgi:hypothetical protein